MPTELPKTYDPSIVEPEVDRAWTESNSFHAEPTDPGDPYAIVIPPPNVTAALHLGHALNNTLQDILTRVHRMMGDNTEWVPGTDHAGIATQTVVEKRVLAEEGKRRTDFPRDEFVKKIQAWKDEYERRITDQLKRMGCSCDWDRQAFTMDEPRARAVREAFFQLFKDGLIYRGKRLVNWDPATQTALADDEVEMEEVDGHFYYLRYPLTDGTGHVTVATTRPETMLGDTAVAINPKDPRAGELKGKHIRLPIVNREIPIIEDEYVVLPVSMGGDENDPKAQFATGFLKVTPAHDPNDYDIGTRHKLPLINVFSATAAISDTHGWPADDFARGDAFLKGELLGKDRVEARRLVVQWFKQNGLLEEVKPYRHSVGHSYRSHVPIEPWLSDQWYCKVTDPRLSGAALRAIANDQFEGTKPNGKVDEWDGGLRFYPARYAKTFQTWHENLRDWAISRQLWWGHRIPVWHKRVSYEPSMSGRETASIYPPFHGSDNGNIAQIVKIGDAAPVPYSGPIDLDLTKGAEIAVYVCLRRDDATISSESGQRRITEILQETGFTQDPDVLDTWFSSALWPLSTLGWPERTADLEKWNPTSVLCTAREIITLWVSRMVMFNLYFLNRLPFRHVFIHAMIQDGHGQKMSKSLGNGVDPIDIIHSHGSDAMRFALASMATNTQDVRLPVDMVDPHTGETFTPKYVTDSAGHTVAAPIQESPKSPGKKMVSSYGAASGKAQPTPDMPLARNTSGKFDEGRKFCNKIWQVALNFAFTNLAKIPAEPVDEQKWGVADRWIVSRLNRTVAAANEGLANYRFDQYAKACYDFFWGDFCDWYVEAIKPALRDPARAGQSANVLAAVLDAALRLMHPVMPFITERIWWRLNEVRPDRGLPGRIACPPSAQLVKAAWPAVGDFSEAAEFIFPKLQETIGTIRNLRNAYQVKPNQSVTVSIAAPGDAARSILGARDIVESLATCVLKDVADNLQAPPNAARATAAGCDIFVEGLVDEAAEQERAKKRCEELKKQVNTLRGRLSNESYTKKAPPHLVQQTRDQLAEAEAELAKLGC